MLIWHKPRGNLCRWVCIQVFLRGRYSRSSLVCYKTVVFRSRNGYMLACWISLICSKKGIFSRLFVFPIICIMINSVRLINSIRLADTVHFGHISIPAVSLRTFSLAHMRVVKSIEVRSAAVVYTMLTDWTAVNLSRSAKPVVSLNSSPTNASDTERIISAKGLPSAFQAHVLSRNILWYGRCRHCASLCFCGLK